MKIAAMIGMGTVGLCIALAAATPAFAHGGNSKLVHACVNDVNKSVRIVAPNDDCNKQETARDWNIAGPQGSQGPQGVQGPQGPAGTGGMIVKDSLGKLVGKWNYNYHMVRQIGPDLLNFAIFLNGFQQEYVLLYYTTTNCTGTRYMWPSYRSLGEFYDPVLTSDGQTGYFASLVVQELSIQSYQLFAPGQSVSAGVNCSTTSFTEKVGLASTVDLSSMGTPPFSLE